MSTTTLLLERPEKMEDDTTSKPASVEYDANFLDEVQTIMQCRLIRPEMSLWEEDLEFLCYQPTPQEHTNELHDGHTGSSTKEMQPSPQSLNSAGLEEPTFSVDRPCVCRSFPRFPKMNDSHNKLSFKIVRANEPPPNTRASSARRIEEPCEHYVAVSYCWPKDEHGQTIHARGSYDVLTTGLELRKNYAPDLILRRAVAFAQSVDARLIWIDQECLPQDGSEAQALGIQSMDILYSRSGWTLGLTDSIRMRQSWADAITVILKEHPLPTGQTWYEHDDLRPSGIDAEQLKKTLHAMESFLTNFSSDRWLTRAWVVQEMFSAGDRGYVSMEVDSAVGLDNTDADQDHTPIVLNAYTMPLRSMKFVTAALKYITERECRALEVQQSNVRVDPLPTPVLGAEWLPFYRSLSRLLQRTESFQPINVFPGPYDKRRGTATPSSFTTKITSNAPAVFGTYVPFMDSRHPREKNGKANCNAAVALSCLSTRYNRKPSDRLAIVANMCSYGNRINIQEAASRFRSLTTCLFALTLMNGDLSLLCPEIYGRLISQDTINKHSWMLPIHSLLPSIRNFHLREDYLVEIQKSHQRYRIDNKGLSLPGYLWSVDRKVDLRAVQSKFQTQWEAMHTWFKWQSSFGTDGNGVPGEENQPHLCMFPDSGQAIRAVVDSRNPSTEGERREMLDQIKAITKPMGRTGLYSRLTIGKIFYAIIVSLNEQKEMALVRSLQHSLAAYYDEFVDWTKLRHGESLLSNKTNLGRPEVIESITPDGKDFAVYLQLWIVEKVMRDGSLWVGKYVLSHLLENFDHREQARSFSSDHHPVWRKRWSHCKYGNLNRINVDQWNRPRNLRSTLVSNNVTSVLKCQPPEWSRAAELQRRHNLVSVFDVDVACKVFTPWDPDMETIPRQERRSMSMSWVVEVNKESPTPRKEYGLMRLYQQQRTQEAEMAQGLDPGYPTGCWSVPVDRAYRNRNNPHYQDEIAEEEKNKTQEEIERKKERDRVRHEHTTLWLAPVEELESFRVVNKVRGCWEPMDEPIQEYQFVL